MDSKQKFFVFFSFLCIGYVFFIHNTIDKIDNALKTQINSSGMKKFKSETYDVCIIGAGLSGAVIAEQYASQLGKTSLVIEKRNHIGGNVFDYIDDETNILVSKYGAHLFHTKHQRVWKYIHQFSNWEPYEHRVLGKFGEKFVPIPVNIDTVNELFGEHIESQEQMKKWLENEQQNFSNPKNSEEMALSRVGEKLYELIFKPYTIKQWAKTPAQLGPEVTARIPVRNNWDDRYFDDVFQALPSDGYTNFVRNMLNNKLIETHINIDYFNVKNDLTRKCGQTYYSGPIDQYFADIGYEKLEYRSINFEKKVVKNIGEENFQYPASVVNHPSLEYDFTRVVEYKHLLKQKSNHTILFYERSTDKGEPYYPVPNERNHNLYKKYQDLTQHEGNVTFVGRLANYKYFNMDETILNALNLFDEKNFKVVVYQYMPYVTGGPEALLQLALAFYSWMPTRTYLSGNTRKREIWQNELGYPEAAMMNYIHEKDLRKGDVYIIPEAMNCPVHLVEKGIRVFIWLLGKKNTEENRKLGCNFIGHNFWTARSLGIDLPRTHILTPYLSRLKTNFDVVNNMNRKELILVNHDDKKVIPILTKFCEERNNPCTVTMLQGFNKKELVEMYKQAKILYASCMRGSERSVIEGALYGVLILTDNCDNSSEQFDFPIPFNHRFSQKQDIQETAKLLFDNFAEEQRKLEALRSVYKNINPQSLAEESKQFIFAIS